MTTSHRGYALPPQSDPCSPTIPSQQSRINYSEKLRNIALLIRYTSKSICRNWRYIVIYMVTLLSAFAILYFGCNIKKSHLAAYIGCGQFLGFFAVYMGVAYTKNQTMTDIRPSPNFLVDALGLTEIDNDRKTRIVEQAYAVVFMTFFCVSPMVRRNVLRDPEQLGVQELINRLLSVMSSKYNKLSRALNDSEVKCVIRELSEQAKGEVRQLIKEDRAKVTNEISALREKCDKYIDMQQKRLFSHSTTIIYASMRICLLAVGLELLCVNFNENQDLKTKCISLILSVIGIFVICLLSVMIVRYYEQIVSPYNDEYDLFGLNQTLNEKWSEFNDFKTSHFRRPVQVARNKYLFNNVGEVVSVADVEGDIRNAPFYKIRTVDEKTNAADALQEQQ